MKKNALLFLVPLLAACLGRATPPEQIKLTQAQNEVLGKFARQVGEKELNILLKDPNDPTLPGIPVGDLLYILSKVNEDRLIQLVKGVSATTTLELLLAIKRVGCTRANTVPVASGYGFDARSTPSINTCKWQQFHLPNIMVQLLNGANESGMTTLIDTLKHSYTSLGLAPNRPLLISSGSISASTVYNATVAHYSFLMKLAYVVAGFDAPTSADPNLSSASLVGPPKLYNLMNLTKDGRDMVFLIDSLDKQTACPGGATAQTSCVHVDTSNTMTTYNASGDLWQDLIATHQMQDTQSLLNIMNQVTDIKKMATLVNGYRSARYATGDDEAQARYFVDRLKVVLYHTSAPTAPFPAATCPLGGPYTFPTTTTAAAAIQQTECDIQNFIIPLGPNHVLDTTGDNQAWNNKLAAMINLITNVDRMMDLVYFIDDGFDANHAVIGTFPNRGVDNLLVMLNNINGADAHSSVPNTTNNEIITAAYLIDNVALDPGNNILAKRNKVKYLAENMGTTLDVLQLACYTAVADQADGVAPMDITPEACDNKGMLNLVASGSKLNDSSATDLSAAGQKMVNLIGGVTDIEDIRFMVRKLTMKNMSDLIAGLMISGTGNTANLINQINGNDCWNSGTGANSSPIGATGVSGAITYDVKGAYTDGTCVVGTTCATAKALRNSSGNAGQVIVLAERGTGVAYYYPAAPAVTIAGVVATATMGRCFYDGVTNFRGFPSTTSTGATGLGKMVNAVNHLQGSITNLVTLINGVTNGQKLGLLINGVSRSSNLVGVLNATVDTARGNNATITDMLTLVNTIGVADTYKLVNMVDSLGDAGEINATDTVPSGDHDMVAQLIAPYSRTGNLVDSTSGVGATTMATLISSLSMKGGGGYAATGAVTASIGGMTAQYTAAVVSGVTGVTIGFAGTGCTSAPTVNVSGGSPTTPAILAAYVSGGVVTDINVISAGSGYTSAPLVSFAGGCAVAPTATALINGIGIISVLNGGGPYTDNTLSGSTISVTGGGAGATIQATVSGGLNGASLGSFNGGTRYVAGQSCPIVGAGGTGGLCTVNAAGGALTGCSAVTGAPSNYAAGRIVRIGGRASIVATVAGGSITGYTISSGGCGYAAPPIIQIVGCGTPPAAPTATLTLGRVTALVGGLGGAGTCTSGTKIIIGETPYEYHADGGTAIVNSVTAGTVTSLSVVPAAINAAQLVQLLDRDATGTGKALIYRADDPAFPTGPGASACSGGGAMPCPAVDTLRPNISAREALVRLLHHGITPTTTSSKSFFNGVLGVGGPAAGVPGTYSMDWPGVGPQYVAGAILNNVTSTSTQSLLTLMNNDTISLEDTIILLGCGDRSSYSNGWTSFSWFQLCSELGPGIW